MALRKVCWNCDAPGYEAAGRWWSRCRNCGERHDKVSGLMWAATQSSPPMSWEEKEQLRQRLLDYAVEQARARGQTKGRAGRVSPTKPVAQATASTAAAPDPG